MKPEGKKPERMAAQSARFEAGQVHLPHDAHWQHIPARDPQWLSQTRHDDQIDVSQFLN